MEPSVVGGLRLEVRGKKFCDGHFGLQPIAKRSSNQNRRTFTFKEFAMYLKRISLIIMLIALFPSLTFAEPEIPGWGEAKWGMSHAAVKKIYDLYAWEPDKIPTCKMKQKIKIMGRDFGVAFNFDRRSDDGKLYRVVLAHFNNDITDTLWLKSVKEMLVEKYGNPITFEIHGKMKTSKWEKDQNRLKLTTLTGTNVMCAIEYISLGPESKKL